MLRELSVQNLALIEDARVELHGGYCAWTGETGAGKSLLLTALGLVLGEKASSDLVRSGKDEARAAAVFELTEPGLREDVEAILGGTLDDESLILTRRISAQGRSQAHANGLPVAVATLRQLGRRLIDLHGQHQTLALLDPDHQRSLLDAFGNLNAVLARYQEARASHDALRKRRQALIEAAERRLRERDLLAFEREELASAEPKPGENDELTREAHRLANAGELRSASSDGYNLLYERDGSVQELLGKVARRLAPLADSVPELSSAAGDLERLAEEVREVARSLRRFSQTWEDDPDRLEEVESRLALYRRLSTRFRCPPDELADRLKDIEAKLAAIDQDDADLSGMDGPLNEAWNTLKEAASDLSAARRKVGKSFAKTVQMQLKALSLGEARLSVEVQTEPLGDDPFVCPPPEGGADRVEIVFAPNPGESPRPLRKIASGGELSRITLAIKTVLAKVDRVPTMIFDEIDTGVGGRLGSVLGRMMASLGTHRQVICITHLPQMASFAAHQWVIRKIAERGRTRTTILPLVEEARVEELAAMLRGDSAAESTRQEALAMLAEARLGG
jgi:DNA repair protein RecN (Recombination protein N)